MPTFDGGYPEPGPPSRISRGREFEVVRPRVYGATVAAAIALPVVALLFVLAGVSADAIVKVLPVATVPLMAILVAANRAYFGSSGIRRRRLGREEPEEPADDDDEDAEYAEYEDAADEWEDPDDPFFPENGHDR